MELETYTGPIGLTPERIAEAGTENAEQKALFAWAALPQVRTMYPQLAWMHAIPNGGLRNKVTAGLLKAMGAKRGVPDIFFPEPIGHCHGLYIELKRHEGVVPKSGKKRREGQTSGEQDEWITGLRSRGYGVAVCVGWQQARATIIAYLHHAGS